MIICDGIMDMNGHPVNGEIRDVNAPLTEDGTSRKLLLLLWKTFQALKKYIVYCTL